MFIEHISFPNGLCWPTLAYSIPIHISGYVRYAQRLYVKVMGLLKCIHVHLTHTA